DVDVAKPESPRRQPVGERGDTADRLGERRGAEELRADVATDADDLEAGKRGCPPVQGFGFLEGHPELVFAQTGGDVGMRARVDVRIDSQGNRRPAPQALRDPVDALELGGGFDVDAADVGGNRLLDLRFALAYAGEEHFGGVAAGGEHSRELAARDDIEAGAEPDRKSTRLNSSHVKISYAVFCL